MKLRETSKSRASALETELEELSQKSDELTVQLYNHKKVLGEREERIQELEHDRVELQARVDMQDTELTSLRNLCDHLAATKVGLEEEQRSRSRRFTFLHAPVMCSLALAAFLQHRPG
uniref:Uncharacterized protein n=1 Tax=Compsopogon caeruleus TaxID=31354 RepID=A0A7S1T492_9RHOD